MSLYNVTKYDANKYVMDDIIYRFIYCFSVVQ